ncbi:MAG: YecA family protein [Eubacteriales bacterium]
MNNNVYDKNDSFKLFDSEINDFLSKLNVDRERSLWKEINKFSKLSDVVGSLTKDEMTSIRKTLDLPRMSAMKKAELASTLVMLIPGSLERSLKRCDNKRYNIITEIIKNSGVMPCKDIPVRELEWFRNNGIIFPIFCDLQKLLTIPCESLNAINRTNLKALEEKASRNTEWIQLTYGMLYYYGVMDTWPIIKNIERLTGHEIDTLEFMDVINASTDYYDRIDYSAYGYYDRSIDSIKQIADEYDSRIDVPFYPFTKDQFLEAGRQDFKEELPAMNNFVGYIAETYVINDQEINIISRRLVNKIKTGTKITELIQYLKTEFEFSPKNVELQLFSLITELYNNTRQYGLKGNTPRDLFLEEKKKSVSVLTADSKKHIKIGRNDPCPCGSGLKYKKCCGR